MGVSVNEAQTITYGALKTSLCDKILATTDTTILNEAGGLDLYFDTSIGNADPAATVIASSLDYTFRFGLKKKATPTC